MQNLSATVGTELLEKPKYEQIFGRQFWQKYQMLDQMKVESISSFPGDRGAGVSGPDVTPEGGGPLEPPPALLAAVVQGGRVHTLKIAT